LKNMILNGDGTKGSVHLKRGSSKIVAEARTPQLGSRSAIPW
jgi:hypothetical protein